MISITFAETNYKVTVNAFREDGTDVVSVQPNLIASDAFDAYEQAIGYFRYAIAEMNCRSIEIQVRSAIGALIQSAEIKPETPDSMI